MRIRLRLCCFASVVVGMPAERYLLSVDLSDGVNVKPCRVAGQNETGAVLVQVGHLTSGSKLSDVTGPAGTRY